MGLQWSDNQMLLPKLLKEKQREDWKSNQHTLEVKNTTAYQATQHCLIPSLNYLSMPQITSQQGYHSKAPCSMDITVRHLKARTLQQGTS